MRECIKVGDFIQGSYRFGYIAGVVLRAYKNKVVIDMCETYYTQCKRTGKEVNVTVSRIREVNENIGQAGFREVETIDTNSK